MKPKSEQVIFPNAVPTPPDSWVGLMEWARQITETHNEVSRQLFDLYGRHLSDALAHPAMWKANRVNRHPFSVSQDGTTIVKFTCSAENPLYLITGETRQSSQPQGYKLYTATSALNCNLAANGLGGLRDGLTVAADTPYYLYAVVNEATESPAILADINDPTIGPAGYGYGEWHYQGAVCTFATAANLPRLISSCGITITESFIEQKIIAPGASTVVFNALPLTAKHAYLQAFATSGIGNVFTVNDPALVQTSMVAAHKNWIGPSFLMNRNPQAWNVTLGADDAALMLRGWIEDPTLYP